MQRGFGYQNRRNAGFSPASLFTGGVQGAWYDPSDSATLFSDRAGTTPCGTPGGGSVVPVGLMLDKSQGLVLGSETVTNGTFDTNINGWTAQTGLSSATRDTTIFATGGLKIVANGAANSYATQTISGLTVGRQYVISTLAYTPSTNPTNNRATIGIQPTGFSVIGSIAQPSTNVIQTLTIRFFATSTTQTIYCSVVTADFVSWGSNGAEAYFDNVSVRELAGNHAIAANDTTARPELRARVNLLTYSEQFDNAAWTSVDATITANAGVAPNGSTTADKFTPNNTIATAYLVQTGVPTSAGTYTVSVYAKAVELTAIRVGDFGNPTDGYGHAVFNLSAGTVTSQTNCTATITNADNGWYRCAITRTLTSGTSNQVQITRNTVTGNGTSGVLIWGAQLIATNEFPANTYQRISDANTYDAVGFPRYLVANGTSSAMSTPGNVNLSGTDKVTVFAGVRKLSDAAGAILAELSASVATNNGSFYIAAPTNVLPDFGFLSRGTAAQLVTASPYAAPVTVVATGIGNIAGAVSAIRINGSQVGINTTSQGTGNFGSYPLFIGARNNSSIFLNGNIYSLIVVGSAVSAGQISATEQWVAGKVGITI